MRGGATAAMLVLGVLLSLPALGCAARRDDRGRARSPGRPAVSAWTVESGWMATTDEAVDDALGKVEHHVQGYLRSERPPLACRPERAFLRDRLIKDLAKDDTGFEEAGGGEVKRVRVARHEALEETKAFPDIGVMHRVRLRVEVTDADRPALREQERLYQEARRQDRAWARQGLMLRGLGGLVAVLGAVAVYLRLEAAARGLYTRMRRPARAALVALVALAVLLGAGLLFLA